MLKHKLLAPEGILILEPSAPLEADVFVDLACEIDPYVAEHDTLSGVMIHEQGFPGWVNLEAMCAHMRFIENDHQKIQRLAVVSDSSLLTELPKLASHLLQSEVKHFSESSYEDSLQWFRSEAQ